MRLLLRCKLSHLSSEQEARACCCAQVIQCRYCPTEVQIDTKVYDGGLAIAITKWLAAGAGVHPSEAKWQSHLFHRSRDTTTPFYFKAGSIQAAFEQKAGFDFKSTLMHGDARQLRQANVSLLRAVAESSKSHLTNNRSAIYQRRRARVDGSGSSSTECKIQ